MKISLPFVLFFCFAQQQCKEKNKRKYKMMKQKKKSVWPRLKTAD